jgi:hypothetical protein
MLRPISNRRLGLALAGAVAMTCATRAHAEAFLDLGANISRIDSRIALEPDWTSSNSGGVHIGLGVRRTLSGGNDIGVRLELDNIDSDALLAVRAFDYRFNRSERFAIAAFLGAARLDLATPAYGYYFGGGVQFKDVLAGWDLGVDLRRGDKIARDNVLPSDPQGGSPDNFYDLTGLSVYFSKRF